MKIYTKTGDKGNTSLYDGNRVGKETIFFEVLGDIDELSSNIGKLRAIVTNNTYLRNKYKLTSGKCYELICDWIIFIQGTLQHIGSEIATPKTDGSNYTTKEKDVNMLEGYIDSMEEENPKLTKFILAGVKEDDAQAHVCRSICRRAERHLWKLENSEDMVKGKRGGIDLLNININPHTLVYINRLSDFLFVLARFLCYIRGDKDIIMEEMEIE